MGKEPAQTQGQGVAKVVDKVMKQKNRFRSGLGFRGDKNRPDAQNDKVRIAQAVSKKKILEGTKADKSQEAGAEVTVRGLEVDEDVAGPRNIWKGGSWRESAAEEEVATSAKVRKAKYVDPRKAQTWTSS